MVNEILKTMTAYTHLLCRQNAVGEK